MTRHDLRNALIALLAVAFIAAPLDAFAGKRKSKKKKAAKVEAPTRPEAPPAAPPPPAKPVLEMEDSAMLEATTVAVQPVFMVGAEASSAWSHVASQLALRKPAADAAAALKDHGISAPEAAEGGFGFAGASSATDIKILHYGIALGFSTALTRIGRTKDAATIAAGLTKSAGLLSGLTPAAQASAKALVALAMGKATDPAGTLLAAAIRSGMTGIASGPQRAHGYYITGVWAGASVLVGLLGGSAVWADMGEPLAVLLDKDASFGGSDRKLAESVRAIATELRAKKPDTKTITAALRAMRTVKADAARSAAEKVAPAPAKAEPAAAAATK